MLKLLQELAERPPLVLLLAQPVPQQVDGVTYGPRLGLFHQLLDCAEINLLVTVLDEISLPCCDFYPLCRCRSHLHHYKYLEITCPLCLKTPWE